ncbi:MAG TPA: YncE family protein [Usitatibacter sp.]|jgi:DNA-binding beta-propeller fold protein YncE|nr:YncE family protein [Usitatibacter sp.]
MAYLNDGSTTPYIEVLDLEARAVVGKIALGTGWELVAMNLSPTGKTLWATSSFPSVLFEIDTETNTVRGSVAIPDAGGCAPGCGSLSLRVSPLGNRVFIVGNANSVTVVDAASRSIVGTIPLPAAGNWDIAFSPGGGRAYVINTNNATMTVIDLASNTAVRTFGGTGGDGAFAVDSSTGLGYMARSHTLDFAVIDFDAGTVTSLLALPGPVPVRGLKSAWHQGTRRTYVANYSTLYAIDVDTRTITATIPIAGCDEVHNMAFNRSGTLLHAACGSIVATVDTAANAVVGSPISIDQYAYRIAVTQ